MFSKVNISAYLLFFASPQICIQFGELEMDNFTWISFENISIGSSETLSL
jgi:hypothetical protein